MGTRGGSPCAESESDRPTSCWRRSLKRSSRRTPPCARPHARMARTLLTRSRILLLPLVSLALLVTACGGGPSEPRPVSGEMEELLHDVAAMRQLEAPSGLRIGTVTPDDVPDLYLGELTGPQEIGLERETRLYRLSRLPEQGPAPPGHLALPLEQHCRVLLMGTDPVGGDRGLGHGPRGLQPVRAGNHRSRDDPRPPGLPLRPSLNVPKRGVEPRPPPRLPRRHRGRQGGSTCGASSRGRLWT